MEQLLAVGVDEGHGGAAGLDAAEFFEDAHAVEDGEVGLAAEVDGLAAGAEGGGEFYDGGAEAVAAEPVGEGGAGDARAGDEDGAGAGRGVGGGVGVEHGGSLG
ncbi:hypothetical protein ACFCZ1_36245 [Streptomyces sp. NPDC056224]|uniref:hypothetical protein n=1 Tax=Streptomyces sp. NPDC056224 TaxID=3345750 RepID=UPI0035E019D3